MVSGLGGLGREDDAARHRRHLHSCPFTVISLYSMRIRSPMENGGVARQGTRARDGYMQASNRLRDMQKPMEEAQKRVEPHIRMNRNPYRPQTHERERMIRWRPSLSPSLALTKPISDAITKPKRYLW